MQGDQTYGNRNRNAAWLPLQPLKRVKNPDDLAATEAKCEEHSCFFNLLVIPKGAKAE